MVLGRLGARLGIGMRCRRNRRRLRPRVGEHRRIGTRCRLGARLGRRRSERGRWGSGQIRGKSWLRSGFPSRLGLREPAHGLGRLGSCRACMLGRPRLSRLCLLPRRRRPIVFIGRHTALFLAAGRLIASTRLLAHRTGPERHGWERCGTLLYRAHAARRCRPLHRARHPGTVCRKHRRRVTWRRGARICTPTVVDRRAAPFAHVRPRTTPPCEHRPEAARQARRRTAHHVLIPIPRHTCAGPQQRRCRCTQRRCRLHARRRVGYARQRPSSRPGCRRCSRRFRTRCPDQFFDRVTRALRLASARAHAYASCLGSARARSRVSERE